MPKYRVTYSYHTTVSFDIEADSEEDAIDAGYDLEDEDDQIRKNLQENGDPEAELLSD